MSAHTKGPWHVGGDGTIIYDSEGWGVASATVFHGRHEPGEAKANARRIVACVNACEGIGIEGLEAMRGTSILALAIEVNQVLKQQHDPLLAALVEVLPMAERFAEKAGPDQRAQVEKARALVASAKAGEA